MTSKEFVGAELEQAYAEVFGGAVNGGWSDGGKDVATNDSEIPAVQVKSSVPFALAFLKESLRRRRFIPICVGDPSGKEEMLHSLKKFGGYVGNDIPRRVEILEGIARVRELIGT
ncbi:MAG: hypothetical protein Q8R17_02070 [bacterium]|nr:hypothetical protein [bacterium]